MIKNYLVQRFILVKFIQMKTNFVHDSKSGPT
jgi:hypothetical protein